MKYVKLTNHSNGYNNISRCGGNQQMNFERKDFWKLTIRGEEIRLGWA